MDKHIAAKQRLDVLRLIHLSATYQSPDGDQSVMIYSTDPANAIGAGEGEAMRKHIASGHKSLEMKPAPV